MADRYGTEWPDLIENALQELGGEARLPSIYAKMKAHPKANYPNWPNTVRTALKIYPRFEHVGPKRSGIWRLSGASEPTDLEAGSDEPTGFEGKCRVRLHKSYEREPRLRKAKIAQALRRCRELRCEVCGFVFAALYGPVGHGFIECHHTVPVPKLVPGHTTTLAELALVCSNCHSMLHRGDLMPMKELSEAVRRNRRPG